MRHALPAFLLASAPAIPPTGRVGEALCRPFPGRRFIWITAWHAGMDGGSGLSPHTVIRWRVTQLKQSEGEVRRK